MVGKCFGLFYNQQYSLQGDHREMLRFSINGAEMIVFNNKSPYFKIHPFNSTKLVFPK